MKTSMHLARPQLLHEFPSLIIQDIQKMLDEQLRTIEHYNMVHGSESTIDPDLNT